MKAERKTTAWAAMMLAIGAGTLLPNRGVAQAAKSAGQTFAPSTGADALLRQVDTYIEAQRQQWHVPGVSVAVVQDGKTVLAKGYGMANVELNTPATKDTVYELLSISKQFTAAAILLLVEEGKVALDAPLSQYLPDTPASWNAITIRHLLTHTSGIRDYTDAHPFFETIRQDATPQELLAPVKIGPLSFAPGTQWRYSNSNYYLLGLVIEKISGKPFADFVTTRIFLPLDMTQTRYNAPTDIVPNRASGYHWLGNDADKMPAVVTGYHGRKNVLQNAIFISPTRKWAAGAFLSTIGDLAKWDTALHAGKLLKPETVRLMTIPATLGDGGEANYGFGNELLTVRGHRMAGHQGGGMAFNTTLLHCLDDHLTVIVLCNQTSAPSRPMALHIASLYVPALAFETASALPDREPQVTALLEKVLRAAQQGRADAAWFAPQAQSLTGFIQREGPQFLGPRGMLKSLTLLDRREANGGRVYEYRAQFASGAIVWRLGLDAAGRIVLLAPVQE